MLAGLSVSLFKCNQLVTYVKQETQQQLIYKDADKDV